MAEITVFPHGDRWAVVERGAASPTQEFPTRDAAEMAARSMAGGAAVEVLEEDPTGLDHIAPGDVGEAPATADGGPVQPVEDAEDPRATQGGL
jgi:Uncharacterized protein conserved in bacteria (DUF2188)